MDLQVNHQLASYPPSSFRHGSTETRHMGTKKLPPKRLRAPLLKPKLMDPVFTRLRYMVVSINGGYTQIILILVWFSIINQPFWGTPFMETPISMSNNERTGFQRGKNPRGGKTWIFPSQNGEESGVKSGTTAHVSPKLEKLSNFMGSLKT